MSWANAGVAFSLGRWSAGLDVGFMPYLNLSASLAYEYGDRLVFFGRYTYAGSLDFQLGVGFRL